MPSIKTSDLRSKNEDQLKKQLEDLSKESFNLRFQSSNGQLSNTGRVKEVRKGIAKVLSKSDDHPDANLVFKRSSKIDSNISMATVYRTMTVSYTHLTLPTNREV